jgi:hypothetical protein
VSVAAARQVVRHVCQNMEPAVGYGGDYGILVLAPVSRSKLTASSIISASVSQ